MNDTPDPYRPHVYLGSQLLSAGRGSRSLAPLARLSIKWGATDWYSNVDPAELTLTLMDPIGEFLDLTADEALPIRIVRDDPGERTALSHCLHWSSRSSYRGTAHDPKTPPPGNPRDVWLVTVTAFDPLNQLAQNRKHGPRYGAPAPSDSGEDWHFGPCRMKNRKADLNARRPAPIDWEPTAFDQFDEASPILIMPVPGYQTNQNVSSLTVLRQTARISNPLNRPYYDPARNLIDFVSPPAEASVRLLDHGKLTARNDKRTHILNGALVPARDGIKVSSEATEQVTRLELLQRSNIDITNGQSRRRETDERSTPYNVVTKNAPEMTVSLATDFGSGYDLPLPWNVHIWALIAHTYGMQTPGQLQWSLKRTAKRAPEELDKLAGWFLQPFPPHAEDIDRPMVFQLMNSLTNWPPGTGPFAVVGGVIEYGPDGWTATLNPAAVPITGASRSLITLGDITSTAPLSAASPDRLVADLHKLDEN